MKKLFPLAILALLFSTLWYIQFSQQEFQPDGYDKFLAKQFSELPTPESLEGLDKFDQPDMFYLFDQIKRMNPKTGLVPRDGLLKAYQEIKKQVAARTNSNQAITWEERGPSGIGGRTRALMYDPNASDGKAVFAGAVGGGLWRTANITLSPPTWINVDPLFSNIAVTCIGYDPTNTSIMYFGTGEGWFNADAQRGAGIWKTTDAGSSWNVLPATTNGLFDHNQKIVVTDLGQLFIASKGGVFKSTDQGLSFTKVLGVGVNASNDFITDIEIAADDDLYCAIYGSGVFHSASTLGSAIGNIGNWTKVSTGFGAGFDRIEIACAKTDANRLYAVTVANQQVDKVYRSDNGGSSWAPTGTEPGAPDLTNGQGWYDLTIEVAETDRDIVYIGGIDVYATNNGGNSWVRVTRAYGSGSLPYMHSDQHTIVFKPGSSTEILFGNDGGIYFTNNAGSTVNERNNGYNVTQFYAMSVDPRPNSPIIIGGTQDNGTIMVNAFGISAGDRIMGADGGYCAIDHINPDTMYATTQYRTVRRSRNGGNSFSSITNNNINNSDVMFINTLEMDPNNPHILYQASKALWRHSNAANGGSGSWVQATPIISSSGISAIGISKSTPNLVYFAGGGIIYRLANANIAFSFPPDPLNGPGSPSGYINCIAVNPVDANHIIAVITNYGVPVHIFESKDAQNGPTATWRKLQGNLPDLPVNWVVFEPGNNNGLVIGTDLGIFRCADIDVSEANIYWSAERTGMGFPRVDMLETRGSDKTIHAATHGRGFFSSSSYNIAPLTSFGFLSNQACGGDVHFIDSTQNTPTTWLWDFGDGTSSTLQSPIHKYATAGTYSVKLISGNSNGTDSANGSITVTILAPANANAGLDTNGCDGDTLQLNASGGATYSWSPTDDLSDPSISNPSVVVTATREYIVTVTSVDGCTDTDTIKITKNSGPNIWAGQDHTITIGDTVQVQAYGGATYLWSPAIGLSCTNCEKPFAFPDTTTTYTVVGTSVNGCTNVDEMTVLVKPPVGIEDELNDSRILKLYPNPSAGVAYLRIYIPKTERVKLTLLSPQGKSTQIIQDKLLIAGEHQITIDGSKLATGIYYLKLESASGNVIQKIMFMR